MVRYKSNTGNFEICIPQQIMFQFYIVKPEYYDDLNPADKNDKYVFRIEDSMLDQFNLTKLTPDELIAHLSFKIEMYDEDDLSIFKLKAIKQIYDKITEFFTTYENEAIYGRKITPDKDKHLMWYNNIDIYA